MIVSILYLKEGFNPTILAGDNGYEKFTNDRFINIFSIQSLYCIRNPV